MRRSMMLTEKLIWCENYEQVLTQYISKDIQSGDVKIRLCGIFLQITTAKDKEQYRYQLMKRLAPKHYSYLRLERNGTMFLSLPGAESVAAEILYRKTRSQPLVEVYPNDVLEATGLIYFLEKPAVPGSIWDDEGRKLVKIKDASPSQLLGYIHQTCVLWGEPHSDGG